MTTGWGIGGAADAFGAGRRAMASGRSTIDPHLPGDVVDALFPEVLEGVREPVADMVAYRAGDGMQPGAANPSSRAAILTPSPKMSCSSTITSPSLTPIRKPESGGLLKRHERATALQKHQAHSGEKPAHTPVS